MTHVENNMVSLRPYNTFAIDAKAPTIIEVFSIEQLKKVITDLDGDPFVLVGGGSNTVFIDDISVVVVVNKLLGVTFFSQGDTCFVQAAAGESWADLVFNTVSQGYFGLENLSLIPGSVGAAPVQNIGAYGVEIKDRLSKLQVLDVKTLEIKTLSNAECGFSYRDSRFKHEWQNKYIILNVTIQLFTYPACELNYPGLKEHFQDRDQSKISSKEICDRVCEIRRAKLPDPVVIPNVGSFFKNPVVSTTQYEQIKKKYPAIVAYPVADQKIKLAAGWMIDQAGWKGKHFGPVGMHEQQALVMVNHGGATGDDVLRLMKAIQDDIHDKFGVELEPEPVMVK